MELKSPNPEGGKPDAFTGPCFSLKNRLARALWNGVWLAFCRFSPRPFHSWRAFWLRLFGARLGKGVHIYPGVQIWAPWNLVIGDECGVGDGARLYSMAKIELGKRVVISQGAYLCTGTHDYRDPAFPLIAKPIHVGDYAWIAAEAFIHPGIQIGPRAVIGARAVVHRSVDAGMLAFGNPATQKQQDGSGASKNPE